MEPEPTPTVFLAVAQIAEASFGERLGKFLQELAEPVTVYAAEVVQGSRDVSPLVLDETAVLDRALVDLTGRLVDGRLQWDVP